MENKITCLHCGFDYVRHIIIKTWTRQPDDETAIKTVVDNAGEISVTRVNNTAENPSSRQHGLSLTFWCEGCDENFELTIAQHKGQTIVGKRPLQNQTQ